MNDLMCRVQAALERDLHPQLRGRVFAEGDYLRAQEVIESEIREQVKAKVLVEVDRQTRGLEEQRTEFRKREMVLAAEIHTLKGMLEIYSAERQRAEEKRDRILAAQKAAQERKDKIKADKIAAERREMLSEQAHEKHAQEARMAKKEAELRLAALKVEKERAEIRRLKMLRTKLYHDTRGWKDQHGNRVSNETAAEIMGLHGHSG